MIIKSYGDLPTTYAPDIGEVVLARRSRLDPYLRAVVLHVKRRRDRSLRIKLQWLESDPNAGWRVESPIVAGTTGVVIEPIDPTEPRHIMQVDRGQPTS